MRRALRETGARSKTERIENGLRSLLEREARKRLKALFGRGPALGPVTRRRFCCAASSLSWVCRRRALYFVMPAASSMIARRSVGWILAEKKKCISCNVCTSVCHQGIDVMNFANKGLPMADPQCVRCSACVQGCPTGVLSFGQVDPRTGKELRSDPAWLAASPVRRRELPVRPA